MTAAVCDQQLTVVAAVVYNSYGARLFTAQTATHISEYAEENRTECHCTQLVKSEAEVTNCARRTSRGLSATTGLLLYVCLSVGWSYCP